MEVFKYALSRVAFRLAVGFFLIWGVAPPRVLRRRFAAGRFHLTSQQLRPGLVLTHPQLTVAPNGRIGWFVYIDSRFGVRLEERATIRSFSVVRGSRRVVTAAGPMRIGRSIALTAGCRGPEATAVGRARD